GAAGEPGAAGRDGKDGAPGLLPVVKTWTPDTVHYAGEVVTFSGQVFQALIDTGRSPVTADWRCLVRAGADARSPHVCGTYGAEETYGELDIVAINGASFIARRDNPGPCPGDGWQLIARQGQRGIAGEKGDRGPV